MPSPANFTIKADVADIDIESITPNEYGTNSIVTMTILGAGFSSPTHVELVASDDLSLSAASVVVDSYSQITATFDLTNIPTGLYSVRVLQPGGDSDSLAGAFTVTPAGAPNLATRLIMPGSLGLNAVATIYVEYANTGNIAMPAPLLLLRSSDPDGNERPLLTMDQPRLIQNFWSAGRANLPDASHEIIILASGAQPGRLNPGERFQVPVYYLGLEPPFNLALDTLIEMEIRFWTADDPTPIDWLARKDALRPPTLDSATWDIVYGNLSSDLNTTGDYIRMLGENADFLGRLGQRVVDANDLWNFEVQQAYGYTAIPSLDSAVDASMPTPGVTLDLARRFSSTLRARNSSGWFGRGWYTPWQATLLVEGNGNLLKLLGEAGSARLFSRDIRNGAYFSDQGDSSSVVAVGSGLYELRDSNGIVTHFRADGRIDYVQDPNGNRVEATYNEQGQLTRLSHTSGAFLTLSYNASGFVSAVHDSAGRATTYTYDATSTYLMSAVTDDGQSTAYTYDATGPVSQRHALTSVTRSGTTRNFTYDSRGRLDSTFLASGERLVDVGYDRAGGVALTDALGTTQLFFDHHGLLVKTIDPLGNVAAAEYGVDLRVSRLISPTGESRSFTWCGCGSLTSFTDELGNTVTFRYDNPLRRLTSFMDARGNTTRYSYDAAGNLLSTTYANGSIESGISKGKDS